MGKEDDAGEIYGSFDGRLWMKGTLHSLLPVHDRVSRSRCANRCANRGIEGLEVASLWTCSFKRGEEGKVRGLLAEVGAL